MLKFEAIRINPSPGEIVELLSEATAAANKRCRTHLLDDNAAKWQKLARQAEKSPEGFDVYRGGRGGVPGTQLVAAWWTDHIGRKHFVVRGRRVEDDAAQDLLFKSALENQPPLWHCYPEFVCQRFRNGVSEFLAVCGCGAVGTPTALGWMGECCGPCHDRREESGKASLQANQPGLFHGVRGPIIGLAFSRDGEQLVGAEGHAVNIWSLADRSTVKLQTIGLDEIHSIGFVGEADSHIVCSGRSHTFAAHCTIDRRSDPPQFDTKQLPGYTQYRILATAQPDRVVVCEQFTTRTLRTWPTKDVIHTIGVTGITGHPDPYEILFARAHIDERMNTSGTHLLTIGREGVNVHDVFANDQVARVAYARRIALHQALVFSQLCVDFDPLRNRLVICAYRQYMVVQVDGNQVRTIVERELTVSAVVLRFSHDGRVLYLLEDDGTLRVLNAETLDLIVAFKWHVTRVWNMALSADGRTLATAGGEGVAKLWQLDRLLPQT
jgi:hypothetical protein